MASPNETPDEAIRFVLDGEVHTVRNVDPNATVLDYLRETLRKTGTKEGCAEGDCGACTVVLAEALGGRLRFSAINACIKFVPTLDGKALFTVESLRAPSGTLHPVQKALVDTHASQCGFCTPGFVMSLFALYRSEGKPSRQRVNDALAGNLCRCTGYRPIVDAAVSMYDEAGDPSGGWLHTPASSNGAPPSGEEQALVDLLEGLRREKTLALTGPAVGGGERRYFAPTTVDELVALLGEHPDAYILAGGTDVGLWVTKAHRDLDTVIYLGDVEELKRIDSTDEAIEIAAGVTVTEAYAALGDHFPDLGELFRRFASPPIRNAATLVGNIANGSPIGDSMPALICLGATLRLRSAGGTRELPLDEFYIAYQKTALEPSEFVESVRVPLAPDDRHFRTYKISKRFDQDISAVCGAYSLRLDQGRAHDVRICYGGMAAIPQRAGQCEAALEGKEWSEATLAEGLVALEGDYTPIDDMRASAGYRRMVAQNLLRKFFLETSGFDGETRILAARS
jgi:xanthine dehydrogenase small subunit